MRKARRPLTLIAVALALLVIGLLLLFLMVLGLIAPGFGLSFLAYAACSLGLILGLLGAFQLRR